jgi:hypothetical protein
MRLRGGRAAEQTDRCQKQWERLKKSEKKMSQSTSIIAAGKVVGAVEQFQDGFC